MAVATQDMTAAQRAAWADIQRQLDAYYADLAALNAPVMEQYGSWTGNPDDFWSTPQATEALIRMDAERARLNPIANQAIRAGLGSEFNAYEREKHAASPMKWGEKNRDVDLFGKIASFALPAAGAFLGGPLGGAVGGALGAKASRGNVLLGTGLGGLAGAISGPGYFADGGGSFINSGFSDLTSGLTDGFASSAPAAGGMSVPATAGGMSFPAASGGSGIAGGMLPAASGSAESTGPLDWLTKKATGAVDKAFSTDNLLKGGLKFGLAEMLGGDNEGGYEAIQNAARTASGDIGRAADEASALYDPYYTSGTAAQGRLASLSGLNGEEAAAQAMHDFQIDPGYTFARDQGIGALDASAARRGMLLSGNQAQAVQKYGTGLANQYFDDYLKRLSGIANTGYGAAGAQSQIGMNAADSQANLTLGGAQAYGNQKTAKANRRNQYLGLALGAFA
ncbi:MAG: hypothetical protein K2X87_25440 [Gemmataceae bacterium]|nr:hypothetical protein [Gemmataceae bacterium]